MAVASIAVVEAMDEEEKEKEEENEVMEMEEDSFIKYLAPLQAPEPWVTMPVVHVFWASGTSNEVASKGLATNLRA